jgi:hypothetical protein
MNNSPIITPEEWRRIEAHIADGPSTTYIHTDAQGSCIVYAGGIMHPRAYLQIVEDDEGWPEPVDIFKHVP